jgi:23S rRNA U2552 (ribose-2'-O)-methylase RlmE/FtsJ
VDPWCEYSFALTDALTENRTDPMHLVNSIKHFAAPEFNRFKEQELASHFSQKIKYTKPEASRSSSSEAYFVCQGFKG